MTDERSLEEEAALLRGKAQKGKRYRGVIDPATQQWLERHKSNIPPFMDEYERALAETNRWTDLGWIAHEDIVRWRDKCLGISAEAGMGLHLAGVSTRLAAMRWNGRRLDPDGEYTLYGSISMSGIGGAPRLTVDDACWLLRQSGLLAS